jgi:hypothetical protein
MAATIRLSEMLNDGSDPMQEFCNGLEFIEAGEGVFRAADCSDLAATSTITMTVKKWRMVYAAMQAGYATEMR